MFVCFSLARDLPQPSSSEGNSLAPEMVERETPPPASPPIITDDTKVLSRRTSPGRREVGKATETAPDGNTSAAKDRGGGVRPPWRPMAGDLTSPAPSRILLWIPTRLRTRASSPLRKRGSSDSAGDLHQSGGAGHLGGSASDCFYCGGTPYPFEYGG